MPGRTTAQEPHQECLIEPESMSEQWGNYSPIIHSCSLAASAIVLCFLTCEKTKTQSRDGDTTIQVLTLSRTYGL